MKVTSAIKNEGYPLEEGGSMAINNEEDWGFGVISNGFTGG